MTQDEKIKQLEEEIRKLQQEIERLKKVPCPQIDVVGKEINGAYIPKVLED